MKRDTNDCFSITAFSYNNNGENYSPRDARSVELANFHWKLVQRYEVFLKVARNSLIIFSFCLF
jgi:hypothetical protein